MKYPKISIVTPSYNQGRYIEQTIQSVIKQNYPNVEYIIIDGGSTDETIEIIKKYESHLAYWISEPDKGQTDAINKGFAKCTGDVFNWINSDDYYEPGTFENLARYFEENSKVNVVCGKEWGFNNDNPAEKTLHKGSIISRNVFETLRIGIIDQPCTFFRKRTIDKFFPLEISLRYVMDRQLWWSYLLKYGQDNILQTDEIFTNFRSHRQSKSIDEADLFEVEFDRLKLSLFQQLKVPEILQKQLAADVKPLNVVWQIKVNPPSFILASFAAFYARRNYIKENLKVAGKLMGYVQRWKRRHMSKMEWKLWFLTNAIPHPLLMLLKNIKKFSKF